MAELLELADAESRERWEGLSLGYTETPGAPFLRETIAALYQGVEPDDVLVYAGAEEAIFGFANVALGPGDHAVVVWPSYQSLHEVARGAGARDHAAGARARLRLGLRPRRPRARTAARDAGDRRQLPPQPDRGARRSRDLRAARRARRRGGSHPVQRRGLPLARVRRRAAPARRGRALGVRGLARGHVEDLRAARPADRLARQPRPRPARAAGRVQGLHDDLQQRPERGARRHRAEGDRPGGRPLTRDRRREPGAARRLLRAPRGRR